MQSCRPECLQNTKMSTDHATGNRANTQRRVISRRRARTEGSDTKRSGERIRAQPTSHDAFVLGALSPIDQRKMRRDAEVG